MTVRERTTDRQGRSLTPGSRVRLVVEDGQLEATVLRVLDDYGVVTVVIEQKTSKVERMYRAVDIELLEPPLGQGRGTP